MVAKAELNKGLHRAQNDKTACSMVTRESQNKCILKESVDQQITVSILMIKFVNDLQQVSCFYGYTCFIQQ